MFRGTNNYASHLDGVHFKEELIDVIVRMTSIPKDLKGSGIRNLVPVDKNGQK